MKSGVAGRVVLERSIWCDANPVLEGSLAGLLETKKRGSFKLPQEIGSCVHRNQEKMNNQILGEMETGGCSWPSALVLHHENDCYCLNDYVPHLPSPVLKPNAQNDGTRKWVVIRS